jgi:hypothetical protein
VGIWALVVRGVGGGDLWQPAMMSVTAKSVIERGMKGEV